MAKVRRDAKGRVLQKGETYRRDNGLYCYSYTALNGKRKHVYARTLEELRN